MKRFITTLTLVLFALCLYAQDIILPKPQTTGGKPLMEALNARATNRNIAEKPLSLEHLSNLLWAATGINRPDGRMTAPTASNNQEIDVYVFLPQGVYLYDVKEHSLIFKLQGDHRAAAARQGAPSGALLVYVADFGRMARYDDAAKEFYSATDTGFVSQNVYLYCASEGLATVVLGMMNRPAIIELLNITNGKVTLGQPVGYPRE
ncbi:MAG: nitroreductase family protein [Bacteroidales bacterium]|nr:nitroreductase family protein [Bacteroidales bacterium]